MNHEIFFNEPWKFQSEWENSLTISRIPNITYVQAPTSSWGRLVNYWHLLTNSHNWRWVLATLTRIGSRAARPGRFGCASMWRSRYITSKNKRFIKICNQSYTNISHPRAKIGVSGKLHDVCNRLSSRGLWAERLGKPLLMRRLRDDVLDGRSGGSVRPGDFGEGIGSDPLCLYDLLKPASIERVFKVFNPGACGGIAGARCSFL